MDEPIRDDLAARRAAKGTVTITVGNRVRTLQLRSDQRRVNTLTKPKRNTMRRDNGKGTYRKRADGTMEYRFTLYFPFNNLRQRKSVYGKTRADCDQKAAILRHEASQQVQPDGAGSLLGPFLLDWLQNVVELKHRPSTRRSYAQIVNKHLIPALGVFPLRKLAESEIQRYLVSDSKASVRVQQLAVIVLRQALDQAVKWDMLAVNPAKNVIPPRAEHREMRVLSAGEARRFLAAAEGSPLFAFYYLAIETGLRQGELIALRWGDIDLENRVVQVNRSYNAATKTMGAPKTRSSRRSVVIGHPTVDVLRAHRARQEASGYSGPLVFTNGSGHTLEPHNVRMRSFLGLQKKAGIEPPVRFHDLRHTAATFMLGAGIHPKIASERLGHARIGTTMDLYQHTSPVMQAQAADAMAEILSPPRGESRGTPPEEPRK